MSTPTYTVVAYRTRAYCRFYGTESSYEDPIYRGPYETLEEAKKTRTKLNKQRCIARRRAGQFTDHGQMYRNVSIIDSSQESKQCQK